MTDNCKSEVGAVVIGRNEGERLSLCLASLAGVSQIIYVDSGSSDDSISRAEALGVDVINLDLTIPFTAARARNEGANYLCAKFPMLSYIQFIDGDCELLLGWLDKAKFFLEKNSKYAVVCGRRKERFPEHSTYNKLCDIEWNTSVGEAKACGGDALISIIAYQQVKGYREDLIAGEEPEMCFRLRQMGWQVYRLGIEMTLHDAGMTKFTQWWKRTVRTGYAFARGSSIHGKSDERYWVKETQSIIFWGILLPALIINLTLFNLFFLNLLFIYPIQIYKIGLRRPDLGSMQFIWAASVVIGKLAEGAGVIRFWFNKLGNKQVRIIEYK